MKITDFKLTHEVKVFMSIDQIDALAEVTVTTWLLWLKKAERRHIFKKNFGWFFVDGGKELPYFLLRDMERSYRAKQLLSACEVKV